jgi:hypothetical protein
MLHVLSSHPPSLDHPNNIQVIVHNIKFLISSISVARFWGFRRGAVKPSLFSGVEWRVVTEVPGQPIRPIRGEGCAETTVTNYQPTLRNTPEERMSQPLFLILIPT